MLTILGYFQRIWNPVPTVTGMHQEFSLILMDEKQVTAILDESKHWFSSQFKMFI